MSIALFIVKNSKNIHTLFFWDTEKEAYINPSTIIDDLVTRKAQIIKRTITNKTIGKIDYFISYSEPIPKPSIAERWHELNKSEAE